MFYEEYGSRHLPTIIMLHGGGLVHSFANQYVLSDKFHLVIPHLYGNGRESHESFDVNRNVTGIINIINQIGKTKVSIIGFSIGAQLIVPLLCTNENLFDKAILASPWVLKSYKTLKFYSRIFALFYPLVKVKSLLKLQLKTLGLNNSQLDECILYYQLMKKENLIGFILNGVNIKDYPEFKDVKIPMIALSGKKESSEIVKSVKCLGKINLNCKVDIWEKYSHNIPMKNSQGFNKVIIDFLS